MEQLLWLEAATSTVEGISDGEVIGAESAAVAQHPAVRRCPDWHRLSERQPSE